MKLQDHVQSPIQQSAAMGETLDELPLEGVGEFVRRFAATHDITLQRTGLDDWAEAVTRASGDDVRLDTTGKLLVALNKLRLITDRQMARLMTNHMRERESVRPVRGL